MAIKRILIIDEPPPKNPWIQETLHRSGYESVLSTDESQALTHARCAHFDLFIVCIKNPVNNPSFLDQLKRLRPASPLILISDTTYSHSLEVHTHLTNPLHPKTLLDAIRACDEETLSSTNNPMLSSNAPEREIIAESMSMKRLMHSLPKIAQSRASVFITGESGTGKEVIAGEIHRLSKRSSQPFIKLNCAAIPETLLESELFGYERGAFTGALAKKTGRFELAHRGTLLLDEVTEIPLSLQPKLLRAIQEQEFERVGGIRPVKVNIRFIATSNRSMQDVLETKLFREDLFYRLNVIPIHLPPLRERSEDILPLATSFLNKFCEENNKPKKMFTEQARQKLLHYHWPGNVRELANIIERTVVLDFEEVIDAEHLYLEPIISTKPSGTFVGLTLHEMEKRLILDTLEAHNHNKTQTATILGISTRTLRNKLQEYGTESDES